MISDWLDFQKQLRDWVDKNLPDPNSYDGNDFIFVVPPDSILPHCKVEIDPTETMKVTEIRFIKRRGDDGKLFWLLKF